MLPMHCLWRVSQEPSPQTERSPARVKYQGAENPNNPGSQPVSHGTWTAVQNISKNDHPGHQGFTIVRPGMSLINIQIAPSTKPIHLGIKTVILKMTQVQFGTCCVLHPLSQMRCTSEQRQAWERPESNMACHWAEEFLFAASRRLRC